MKQNQENMPQKLLNARTARHWQDCNNLSAVPASVHFISERAMLFWILWMLVSSISSISSTSSLSLSFLNPSQYREKGKGLLTLLSSTQAGPGRKVKQEQEEEVSTNNVQTF